MQSNPFDQFDAPQPRKGRIFQMPLDAKTQAETSIQQAHANVAAQRDQADLAKAQAEARKAQLDVSQANQPIDPQTVTYYAQQILAGAPMPSLGMGKQAAAARQAIMSEVAKTAGARGLNGADLATQIAHYKAGSGQIADLEKKVGTVGVNEQTALANGQQYLDRSAELPGQTGIAPLNAVSNFIQRKFGGTAISAADAAYNTFVNEYAKVVAGSPNGAGTLSDSARHEAMSTISGNGSLAQKQAAFDQMKADMANRMIAMHGGINQAYKALTNQPGYQVPDSTQGLAVPGAGPGNANGGPSAPPMINLGPNGGSGGPGGGVTGSTPVSQFGGPAGSGPGPGTTSIETGSTQHFSTLQDRAYQAALQRAFNKGASRDQIQTLAKDFGYPALGSDLDKAIAYRDKGGQGATIALPQSGARDLSSGQQELNNGANTALGTAAIHAGLAVGALPNGVTRLAGRALGFNGDMRNLIANPEQNDAVLSYLDSQHPKSAIAGDVAGGLVGLGGVSGLAAKGLARTGLSEGVQNIAAPILGDAAFGGLQGAGNAQQGSEVQGGVFGSLAGAGGGLAGRYVAAPLASRIAAPLVNSSAGVATANAANGMLGSVANAGRRAFKMPEVPFQPKIVPDAPSSADTAIFKAANKTGIPDIQASLAEAQRLGVPMSLADTSPQMTSLAGAAVRRSPNADQIAQTAFLPRSRGQIDRFGNAVQSNLGPIGNTLDLSNGLQQQARTAAAPLYAAAYSAEPMGSDTIDGLLNRPFGKSALDKAQMIAANDGKSPTALGFRRDAQGNVILDPAPAGPDISNVPPMPADGLYANVKAPNEADTLGRRNIPSPINGAVTMPKRGPLDLVSFLRTKGGLKPQGGELDHYGITNAPRTGMDFAGGEGRFGKLVDPVNGMNYDDAAQLAHEAGYFPGHYDRPSVDEFLDTLNQTHSGNNRAFTPEDMPEVDNFNAARDARWNVEGAKEAGAPLINYLAQPVGMNDLQTPPMSAYKPSMEPLPPGSPSPVYTPETLDYVKRGMDSVLEKYRDPTTGRLDLSSNPQALSEQGVRKQFVSAVDALNPSYRDARQAFAGPMQSRDALHLGQDLFSSSYGANDVGAAVAGKSPEQISQMQLGYRDSLMNAANLLRRSSNPFGAIDSPTAEAKLGGMYFDNPNVPQFLQTRDMENGLARSTNDVLGNSKTAQRGIADNTFAGESWPQTALDLGINLGTGQVPVGTALKIGSSQAVKDALQFGIGQRAVAKADAIAPTMFNTDPSAASASLSDLVNSTQAYRDFIAAQRAKVSNRLGMLGSVGGSALGASLGN